MKRIKEFLKKWLGVSDLERTANLHQHRLDTQRDKIDDKIAGFSVGEIAAQLGIAKMTAYNHPYRARKAGLPVRPKPLRGQPWLKVVAQTRRGQSVQEIAKTTGLTAGTIKVYQCHAREAGDLPGTCRKSGEVEVTE